MAKRKHYFQVHKNKYPKVNQVLKLIKMVKHFNNVAKAASKSAGAIISMQYSRPKGTGKIGQVVCIIDSEGGSV